MKTINRRAFAALVFGFLTIGAGASFAQEPTKAHASAQSCCGPECCAGQSQRVTSASNYVSQWYKAKYGRELPGTRPADHNKAASDECCKHCC